MNESERELMRSLQALAQPVEVQRSLFPDFVCVPDELALDFEQALKAARHEIAHLWSGPQSIALEVLDREIESVSGQNYPEIWIEPDSLSHPQWEKFRVLATSALAEFNWPINPPPPNGATYVGTPGA